MNLDYRIGIQTLIYARFDEFGLSNMKLHDFFKENGYKNPDSLTNNPYTHAHDTRG